MQKGNIEPELHIRQDGTDLIKNFIQHQQNNNSQACMKYSPGYIIC